MLPEHLAQSLKLPLFKSTYLLPRFPDGEWGHWRVRHTGTGIDHGYFTRQWVTHQAPVLERRRQTSDQPDQWDTWMSLTPHEIESQELGCLHARGHTVIMGLGMGWIAINAALNRAVEQVTIVERDPAIIAFLAAMEILSQVPLEARSKIRIVEADALEWIPDRPVDFLFADIWRCLGEPETISEVHRMQEHVGASTVYYWGQELRLYLEYKRMFGESAPLQQAPLEECVAKTIGLPLLLPREPAYTESIRLAAENRLKRGLPLERSPAPT